MSELPEGWVETKIGDLFSISTGKLDANAAVEDGEYPFFTCAEKVSQIDRFAFDCEAVLLAGNGGFGVKKYRGKFEAYQRTYVLELAEIELDYAYHLVKHLVPQITSSNRGSTIKYLRLGDITEVATAIPPLPEQRRIVAKLDRLSARSAAASDHLAQTTKLATRAKQAILSAAVSGELTRTWRENRAGLGRWRDCTLGDIACGFNYGSAAKSAKEGDVPVLRMGNIQKGKLDWTDLVFTSNAEEISKYELHSGDVLFNRTNSPALVGKTTVYRGERPAIFAGYLIRVLCGPEVLPDFVNACLNSGIGRDYCWQVKTDGVSQSNINAKKLKGFPMNLPPVEEQREIIRRIEAAFTHIENLTAEASRAAHLLDRLDERLLAKAFRGELAPQSPDDEPAEALLTRIRQARAAAPKPKRGRRKKATAE